MRTIVVIAAIALAVHAVSLPTPPENWYIELWGKPTSSTVKLRAAWQGKYQWHDYMYDPQADSSYNEYQDSRRSTTKTWRITGSSCALQSTYAAKLSVFGTPDLNWSGPTTSGSYDKYTVSGVQAGGVSCTYTAYFMKDTTPRVPVKMNVYALLGIVNFDMTVTRWHTTVQSQ
jgi:hypothetical protein